MSGHSNHGASCGCDADEHQMVDGSAEHLYNRIDRDNVVALNSADGKEGKVVIKSWEQRNDETEFLESDADEQLILHIPFTGSIKLRSIIIKAGPAGHTPDKVKIFANQTLDFDEASTTEVTQTIDLALTRDPVEYSLRPAKFPAIHHLTLFFPSNQGEDTTRVSFVGFKGEYSPLTRDPIITVYETQANPADHNKIQGMDTTNHNRIG